MERIGLKITQKYIKCRSKKLMFRPKMINLRILEPFWLKMTDKQVKFSTKPSPAPTPKTMASAPPPSFAPQRRTLASAKADSGWQASLFWKRGSKASSLLANGYIVPMRGRWIGLFWIWMHLWHRKAAIMANIRKFCQNYLVPRKVRWWNFKISQKCSRLIGKIAKKPLFWLEISWRWSHFLIFRRKKSL